jgi:NAD(P)-dependent dehydrogenase (short-subunit alcohol dehydrogenase family)
MHTRNEPAGRAGGAARNAPPRIVVITGASGGIGAAAAAELGRRGDTVILVARRPDALAEAVGHAGPRARGIVADMTVRSEVQRVVREVLATEGWIDVWVNNVGQGISRLPSDLTDQDLDLMMVVNVKSALYGMQEILPHFRERGRGQVINVSSMLARVPSTLMRSAYSAAKHFLNALTANFRMEVQETHPAIQFSLVSPGPVRTEFGANAMHGGPPSSRLPATQGAEEIAVVMADLLDSRRPDVYTRAGARERVVEYYAGLGEDP